MAILGGRSEGGDASLARHSCGTLRPDRRRSCRSAVGLLVGLTAAMCLAVENNALRAPAAAGAAPTVVTTPAIYAAFTLNLTRFITWPEGAFPSKTAPLVIGTFPRDPINDALDEAAK